MTAPTLFDNTPTSRRGSAAPLPDCPGDDGSGFDWWWALWASPPADRPTVSAPPAEQLSKPAGGRARGVRRKP